MKANPTEEHHNIVAKAHRVLISEIYCAKNSSSFTKAENVLKLMKLKPQEAWEMARELEGGHNYMGRYKPGMEPGPATLYSPQSVLHKKKGKQDDLNNYRGICL
jgi:hypothetical protein